MKEKKQKHLFFSLAAVMAIPVFILGIIVVIMSQQSVKEGMELEICKALAGVARETADMYNVTYPGSIRMEDDRFLMGETDLTDDFALADRISENTGTEITVFYGNVRVITTITDSDGNRIVGTTIEDEVITTAIANGNEYYSGNVKINGNSYYGYYVPFYNGEEVCGMVFAGMTNENVVGNSQTIAIRNILLFLLAFLLILGIASAYAKNLVGRLDKIRGYIGGLAGNNLNEKMPESVLKRNDEIGEMGRHAVEVGKTIKGLIYNDPLTRLFNRRAGRIEMEKYMEKADWDSKEKVAVALGDIDYFKSINDRYGHDCGDMVLVRIAKLFRDNMEGLGFAARWGGEEFLLVFHGGKEDALSHLQEIVDQLRGMDFVYEETHFSVTMTFGISEYESGDNMDKLVKKADDLLYQGKEEGRNRIKI